jgi:hypothetical protein
MLHGIGHRKLPLRAQIGYPVLRMSYKADKKGTE